MRAIRFGNNEISWVRVKASVKKGGVFLLCYDWHIFFTLKNNIVKTLLSGPLLSGHPLWNDPLSNSQKAFPLFTVNFTSTKRSPFRIPNWLILLYFTSIKRARGKLQCATLRILWHDDTRTAFSFFQQLIKLNMIYIKTRISKSGFVCARIGLRGPTAVHVKFLLY